MFFRLQRRNLWCADKVNNILPQATALVLLKRSDTIDAMKKVGRKVFWEEDIRIAIFILSSFEFGLSS